MTTLGYLGPSGTNGEQAALTYDPKAELVALPSHTAVINAVRDGTIEHGVAAVENSLEGAVNETLDTLLAARDLHVCAELVLAIEQNLIAAPGTRLEDITLVISHPQALGQCRGFLESKLPNARIEAALSTAAGVAQAVRTPNAAGIAGKRAAEVSGGVILAEAIQDTMQNMTRFLVVANADAEPTGRDKTSIAFTIPHDRPGTLMGALRELADRGINLTHIESRPSREQLGIYVFLIDFDGHRLDPLVSEALDAIRAQANTFRILGSYPGFES